MCKYSASKLVVECFGTFMLTLFFYGGGQAVILAGLWILIVFGWKISGSHYNPAVTLAYMLRKDGDKIPKSLGIAYMLIQTLGAFLAACMLIFFTNNNVARLSIIEHCFSCDYNPTTEICQRTGTPVGCGGIINQDYYDHHYTTQAVF